MKKLLNLVCVFAIAPLVGFAAQADDAKSDAAMKKLRELRPDLPIAGVNPGPVPGFYEIELTGSGLLYVSEDGEYLVAGDFYRLTDTDLVNLTESRRNEGRRKLIEDVDVEDMVVFAPPTTKAVVNVFTDVDCGFCRKLHLEMADYHAQGIEVRYLAYPRAGVPSDSYDKIVSAWCSKDPQGAITKLKLGRDIPRATCDNPVADQYELGRVFGVTGTPSIVTQDGRVLPGYMPAADLAKELGI